MAALKLTISRCSSQDKANRVENILCRNKGKWLCNADNTSSKIEAEIQLSEATKIAFINIGNAGSAFIEILAGNSLWPSGKEYVTFLASTMLMSPGDSKTGQNKERVRMFDKDSFVKGVADGEWDRLRIIIRQPYIGKKQYGLHFIDIIGDDKLTNNDTSSKTSKYFAAFKSKLQVAPPVSASTSSGSNLSSPSSRAASLVKAAQLNLNPVKQKPKEESRPRKQHKVKRNSPYQVDAQLQRRKSLSRRTAGDIEDEVECFLDGFNFEKIPLESITYKHLKETMEEARGSKLSKEEKKIFLKLAERQVRNVLEKRDILDEKKEAEEYSKNPTVIDLSSPKSNESSSPIQTPTPPSKFSISPPVSPATSPLKSRDRLYDFSTDSLHECPLCNKFFPLRNIEFHASICAGATTRETIALTSPTRDSDIEEVQIPEVYSPVKSLKTVCDLGSNDDVSCPICNCRFPKSRIDVHANICADAGLLVSS